MSEAQGWVVIAALIGALLASPTVHLLVLRSEIKRLEERIGHVGDRVERRVDHLAQLMDERFTALERRLDRAAGGVGRTSGQ